MPWPSSASASSACAAALSHQDCRSQPPGQPSRRIEQSARRIACIRQQQGMLWSAGGFPIVSVPSTSRRRHARRQKFPNLREQVGGEPVHHPRLHRVEFTLTAKRASPRSSRSRCSSAFRLDQGEPHAGKAFGAIGAGRSGTILSIVNAEGGDFQDLAFPLGATPAHARRPRPHGGAGYVQSLQQLLAARAEHAGAARPARTAQAEFLLETADLPRQRGLRNVQHRPPPFETVPCSATVTKVFRRPRSIARLCRHRHQNPGKLCIATMALLASMTLAQGFEAALSDTGSYGRTGGDMKLLVSAAVAACFYTTMSAGAARLRA